MKKSFISCFIIPCAALTLFASTGCATAHDCAGAGGAGGSTASSSSSGGTLSPPICGNGILEAGEQCDGKAPPWIVSGKTCNKKCVLVIEVPPVINEIYYQQGQSTGAAVEIFGSPGYDLTGWSIESVSPVNGMPSLIAPLKDKALDDAGYFLIVQDKTVIFPATVPYLESPAAHFQDGPAYVRLTHDGKPSDAVGWGDFPFGGSFLGEGMPAMNPMVGSSLCRAPSGVDTNHNEVDFVSCKPTVGAANLPGN